VDELRKVEDGYRKAIALQPNEGSYYTALARNLVSCLAGLRQSFGEAHQHFRQWASG
jgi:hypothetical protein